MDSGRFKAADAIGQRVGKVVNQYKVSKHFELQISDESFSFKRKRKHEAIAAEAALDGIYIIRTSVEAARMEAADCVRNYKAAGQRRAGLPQPEDGGPEGATDPPPHG